LELEQQLKGPVKLSSDGFPIQQQKRQLENLGRLDRVLESQVFKKKNLESRRCFGTTKVAIHANQA